MGRDFVRELLQGEEAMSKMQVKTAALFVFWKPDCQMHKGGCRQL